MIIELFINSMLSWSSLAWDSMSVFQASGGANPSCQLVTLRFSNIHPHDANTSWNLCIPFDFSLTRPDIWQKSWHPRPPMPHGSFPGPRGFPQVPVASTSSPKKALRRGAAEPRRTALPSATRRARRPSCARRWRRCRSTCLGWQRSEGIPRGFNEQMIKHDQTPGIFDRNLMSKL
jgi:hypothetical protein